MPWPDFRKIVKNIAGKKSLLFFYIVVVRIEQCTCYSGVCSPRGCCGWFSTRHWDLHRIRLLYPASWLVAQSLDNGNHCRVPNVRLLPKFGCKLVCTRWCCPVPANVKNSPAHSLLLACVLLLDVLLVLFLVCGRVSTSSLLLMPLAGGLR